MPGAAVRGPGSTTCPGPSLRRAAGIPCPTRRTLRPRSGSWGIDAGVAGGRLRSSQQRLRRPALVDVAVDGPLRCRRSQRRLRRVAARRLAGVSAMRPYQRHAKFTARRDDRLAISTVELQSALSSGAVALVDARAADRFAGRNETSIRLPATFPELSIIRSPATSTSRAAFSPRAHCASSWLRTLGARSARRDCVDVRLGRHCLPESACARDRGIARGATLCVARGANGSAILRDPWRAITRSGLRRSCRSRAARRAAPR